jgi:hypothetical protein
MTPIEINIKSSSIEKLIDVISSAIGKLSAPFLLRKMAEVKRKEIILISESIEQVRATIGQEIKVSYDSGKVAVTTKETQTVGDEVIISRIDDRLRVVEKERQENLDRITLFALKETARIVTSSSPDAVDKDWINRFFTMSQDISNEQMHEVWGKILAGEVHRPGSFSLRSLEVLRNLSQQEAETFRQMLQYLVKVGENCFYIFDNEACPYRHEGSAWNKVLQMRDLGLISESVFYLTLCLSDKIPTKIHYGDMRLNVLSNNVKDKLQLQGAALTGVDRELSTLIEIVPVAAYFNCLKSDIEKNGFICTANI